MAAAALAWSLAAAVAVTGLGLASAPAAQAGKAKLTAKQRKQQRLKKIRRANRKQKRPNILVVMTDDQSNSMAGLPRTARLIGGKGTTFRSSYVSFPLCCPARATFLTGQYAHNHGVVSTRLPNGYNALNHGETLATWLRAAGYRTGMVGKYLNGYGIRDGIPERKPDAKQIPKGWSEWYALTKGTDQRRYHFRLNENGKIRKYKKGRRSYVTDVLNRKAVKFVKRYAPRKKPFFLWYNPTAPHGEAALPTWSLRNPRPARRHLGLFNSAHRPRAPNFNEQDVSNKPPFVRTRPPLGPAEIADIDNRHRGRIESLLSVDEGVKRLMKRLRKAKDMRKTYIFFTSDNGLALGAHRLLYKNYLYEEDTRVPLMIKGPRFPKGAVRDQPVSNVDLAPTILELTGVRARLPLDGRSLLGRAINPGAGVGRELLLERAAGGPGIREAAIRKGRWIYIDRLPASTDELYDLAADPFQLKNLHDDPAHAGIRDQLAQRLARIRSCRGSACP